MVPARLAAGRKEEFGCYGLWGADRAAQKKGEVERRDFRPQRDAAGSGKWGGFFLFSAAEGLLPA